MQSGSVLRRLARPAAPQAAPVTPARAIRLALTRAAERSSGLGLSVLSVAEEVMSLDQVLSGTGADLMLLGLCADDGRMRGFIAIDLELRTALIESQTMGRLRTTPAEQRPITATDAALAQPLAGAFLAELTQAAVGTPLDGWAGGHHVAGRLPSLRAVETTLADGDYRTVRLSVDLAAGERQGTLILVLAMPQRAEAAAPDRAPRFADALRANVMAAEAELHAVLHRLRMPLVEAERLRVGHLLVLPGVNVGAVRIEAADGRVVGRGRLGQTAGLRAVRIEGPTPAVLTEARLGAPSLAAPHASYGGGFGGAGHDATPGGGVDFGGAGFSGPIVEGAVADWGDAAGQGQPPAMDLDGAGLAEAHDGGTGPPLAMEGMDFNFGPA